MLLPIFASMFLISQASAAALVPRNPLRTLLAARQGGGLADTVPAPCKPKCNVIYGLIETCKTTSCLCTPGNARLLEGCVDCIVGLAPTPQVIASGQYLLDQFGETCIGTPGISSLTLSLSTTVNDGLPTNTRSGTAAAPDITTVTQRTVTANGPDPTPTRAAVTLTVTEGGQSSPSGLSGVPSSGALSGKACAGYGAMLVSVLVVVGTGLV
ncbi:hypothetical protein Hypma_011195 [Hypsizygus marmoreus]|uniref:Extracellular membrane protein CFEM domain-containing protein n=1 Tax=Hypsizygus marmoreus TaxID=39966 RepID=A0A369JMC8_HYPMA|nr:hypothetical protein Hypma_011195 [Hypsizygus marmoreus]